MAGWWWRLGSGFGLLLTLSQRIRRVASARGPGENLWRRSRRNGGGVLWQRANVAQLVSWLGARTGSWADSKWQWATLLRWAGLIWVFQWISMLFQKLELQNIQSTIFPMPKNSKWILNSKSRNKNQFEFGLNFKGGPTFWEKSHKFTKNLFWHDLQYCQFWLTHLYSKIWSSFTSGN
jgi:hypothetical protein